MVAITRIDVRVTTGSKGTNGRVFAGVGGREFLLDTNQNDFRRNQERTFTLGASSNVKNEQRNDPRVQGMDTNTLDAFPAYLRVEPASGVDDLIIDTASITVNPGSNQVQFAALAILGAGAVREIRLGNDSGHTLYMRRAGGVQPLTPITRIEVRLKTDDVGYLFAPGTNGRVYLGIGGREFALNTINNDFDNNSDAILTIGVGSTIRKPDLNNPQSPRLTIEELDVFPVYLRHQPRADANAWMLQRATVTVNPGANQRVFSPPFLQPATLGGQVTLSAASGQTLFMRPV